MDLSVLPLIPLSEDLRLSLVAPRFLDVVRGDRNTWDEVTVVGRRERRSISLKIHVEAGAKGSMFRVFEVPEGSRLTIYHDVQIDEGADWYNSICVRGQGEVTIRRALNVLGESAKVRLGCVAVMDKNARLSVSDEVFCMAPRADVQVQTKIVLKHEAKSEARGRIVIEPQAQDTTATERVDHVVFGERATVAAIPELEVKTDMVVCGHGATTSRVGEDELFYLMSHGLAPTDAERLLMRGFLASGLQTVSDTLRQTALAVLTT